MDVFAHRLRRPRRHTGESQRKEVPGAAAGAHFRSTRIPRYEVSARRRAAATVLANVAAGRLPGFDLLESLVRLLGGIDVEHLRPRQVEQSVWHRVAPFACNEKRNRVAGQCRTRRQYRAGLLRAGDARLSAMDRAASRVLGDVHDDGVRSDDWNIARGNNIAEPRYAVESAAE